MGQQSYSFVLTISPRAHVKCWCTGYGQEPSQCGDPRERHPTQLVLPSERIDVLVRDGYQSDRVLFGGHQRTEEAQ